MNIRQQHLESARLHYAWHKAKTWTPTFIAEPRLWAAMTSDASAVADCSCVPAFPRNSFNAGTENLTIELEVHEAVALDLISSVHELLSSAIAWADAQSRHANEAGSPLDSTGLALARWVGVRYPHLIRMQIVDALPLPDDCALREAARAVGLFGPSMVGLTLGYSIFTLPGHRTPRFLSHECRHVYQFEAAGSIAAFLPIYLRQVTMAGHFFDAPLERDARAHEVDRIS